MSRKKTPPNENRPSCDGGLISSHNPFRFGLMNWSARLGDYRHGSAGDDVFHAEDVLDVQAISFDNDLSEHFQKRDADGFGDEDFLLFLARRENVRDRLVPMRPAEEGHVVLTAITVNK